MTALVLGVDPGRKGALALVAGHNYHNILFEVRRVPAPEPATEWVPLTKLVGRTIKGETELVGRFLAAINGACRWTSDGTRWHYFPDGTINLDTARVLVLAEGERS